MTKKCKHKNIRYVHKNGLAQCQECKELGMIIKIESA